MARLVVFADHWGRHPSSCQHLVRRLLERHPTVWVNSIGMRRPGLSREDLAKAREHLRLWIGRKGGAARAAPPNLTVITPPMWPGFRRQWQRRLNAALVRRALGPALAASGARREGKRVVLATLPIAVAFADTFDADAWVYYCVDDHSQWPGLDGPLMAELERELLARVDTVVAASAVLAERLSALGRTPMLLTHGVDLGLWKGDADTPGAGVSAGWGNLRRPIALFWGLVDRRLDASWLEALVHPEKGTGGSVVLVGPWQGPDAALARLERVHLQGPMPYESLPRLARAADVLVMPYADMPATRAMQPLKLMEYLATDKPVVVRDLPATREWADAADIVTNAADFARRVGERAASGAPAAQLMARRRLVNESWGAKARQLEAVLFGDR